MAKSPEEMKDEALAVFLSLSDEEQTQRIADILDEVGIFDENDELKDNWREILRAYRKWRGVV